MTRSISPIDGSAKRMRLDDPNPDVKSMSPDNFCSLPSFANPVSPSHIGPLTFQDEASANTEPCKPAGQASRLDEKVCFGMIVGIEATIEKMPPHLNLPIEFPVSLEYSGRFASMDDSHTQGQITNLSHTKMVQGLREEPAIQLQILCKLPRGHENSQGERSRANSAVQGCSLSIIVYGTMELFDDIGQYFQEDGVYLQDPQGCEHNVRYCNPHRLSWKGLELAPLTWDLALTLSTIATEAVCQKVDDPELLVQEWDLDEVEQPWVLKTALARHQKQALSFMLLHERRSVTSSGDTQIWESVISEDLRIFINRISETYQEGQPPDFQGGIIADPMGLGKTLTMISLIATDTVAKHNTPGGGTRSSPTLVIVPAPLLNTWEEELKTHVVGGGMRWCRYHGKSRLHEETDLDGYDMVLTTYHTVAAEWRRAMDIKKSFLFQIYWRRLILDEAHYIRNINSQIATSIFALEAESRWAVTGTPIQNGVGDLSSLLKFLRAYPYDDPRVLKAEILQFWKRGDPEEAVNRFRRLIRCLLLRRPKATCQLPARHDLVHQLKFSKEEKSYYEEYRQRAFDSIEDALLSEENPRNAYAKALQQITTLRMICTLGTHYRPQSVGTIFGQSAPSQEPEWMEVAQRHFKMIREMGDISCHSCDWTLESSGLPAEPKGTDATCQPTLARCLTFTCPECVAKEKSGCNHILLCPKAAIDLADTADEEKLAVQLGQFDSPRSLDALPTKVTALLSDLKGLDSDIKCIVFSSWRLTLDLVHTALIQSSIPHVRIDGSVPQSGRQIILEEFKQNPSIRVLLMTLSCGAVGLTLTASSRAYLMEPHWNPAQEEQALARIHRMGQTREVTTIRFIIKDSFEEQMIQLQDDKKRLASALLSQNGAMEESVGGLQRLRSLLR